MKALVLGASGFLGSYAGFALTAAGWDVTGASRSPVDFYPRHLEMNSLDDIPTIFRREKLDVVINCVAMANHEQCEENPSDAALVNAELPGVWSLRAAEIGAQFVHFSTDAVFDGRYTGLYEEDDTTGAPSVYGLTKRAGEESVLAAHPGALVFRTNFFGWSRDHRKGILDFFVNGLENQTPMAGFSDYVVSSLYVGHLFDLVAEAVSSGASGVYHLTSSTPLSKYDFGVAVADALGSDNSLIEKGLLSANPSLANRGHNLSLSVAKLEALVGHAIPTTTEGIARALHERHAVMEYFGGTAQGKK